LDHDSHPFRFVSAYCHGVDLVSCIIVMVACLFLLFVVMGCTPVFLACCHGCVPVSDVSTRSAKINLARRKAGGGGGGDGEVVSEKVEKLTLGGGGGGPGAGDA
jgi:hypothetical protein